MNLTSFRGRLPAAYLEEKTQNSLRIGGSYTSNLYVNFAWTKNFERDSESRIAMKVKLLKLR